ncbi:MAG: AbrB/MazE/SpoVT family DNA-binding domain-containing protein [Propionibacteriaceae bacterium]|nr:AbrB/MazE/SpoVT family DNA-binding domain-containing protein [Propionibacteriaceae bacterium]
MDVTVRVTSKGQVTLPKAVRDALGIKQGDSVAFRVEEKRAILARSIDFLDLAGSIYVARDKRGAGWGEIRRETRSDRTAERH